MIEECDHAILKLVENCTSLFGFEITNSSNGGTGSGFTSLLIERLSNAYPKKVKITHTVVPSPNISSVIVEPYNAI